MGGASWVQGKLKKYTVHVSVHLNFQAVIIGVLILSIYFCAVVLSFYHELKASVDLKNANVEDTGVGSPIIGGIISSKEETVLVTLENEEESTSPKLPNPDEIISLANITNTNPFISDVFKVKQKQQSSVSDTKSIEIQSDFTPFKKSNIDSKTPAKIKVFLPGGGDESDFDFSFNDPDFDSSLCAQSHPEVEN